LIRSTCSARSGGLPWSRWLPQALIRRLLLTTTLISEECSMSSALRTSDFRSALASVVDDVITPAATEVDQSGVYPRAALDALGAAGVLGLLSATDVGGEGGSLADVAEVIETIARACGSTAMVVLMHFAATSVIEAYGPREVREAIARGGHVSSLAFSEAGSRSHFWAPLSSATADGDGVRLDAAKSWITSAGEADSYVWSSRPLTAAGPMTLWLVPAGAPGLTTTRPFDGLGCGATPRARYGPMA
jgi:isovaleryl-CoA dehydrogenase